MSFKFTPIIYIDDELRQKAIKENRKIVKFLDLKLKDGDDTRLILDSICYYVDGSVKTCKIELENPFYNWDGTIENGLFFNASSENTWHMSRIEANPIIFSKELTDRARCIPIKMTEDELTKYFGRPVEIVKDDDDDN